MVTYKTGEKKWFSFNAIKCVIRISYYQDGRMRLELLDKMSLELITIATIGLNNLNEFHSKMNKEVIIQDWGVNEGLYNVLRNNNIISRSKHIMKIGFNDAPVCDLIIDEDEAFKIEKLWK